MGQTRYVIIYFCKKYLQKKPIEVYNFGKHSRDFTYIDDIVDGIIKCLNKIPKKNVKWNPKNPDLSTSVAPFKILNLGNGKRITLLGYIKIIEKNLGKKAILKFSKMQLGDIQDTLADIKETKKYLGFKPKTTLNVGIKNFVLAIPTK